MGNDFNLNKNNQISEHTNNQNQDKDLQDNTYDLDVIEVSNLAIAIKNKQPTINIEISLACQSLPEVDIFGLADPIAPMVVCFKKQYLQNSFQLTEIGRTEFIRNQLNPIFIKSFIHYYNEQKVDEITFRIYDVHMTKSDKIIKDLRQHNLIGTVETNMREIVEAQPFLKKQIIQTKKRKSKSYLKIMSSQYDGGNSKYQIELSANSKKYSRQTIFIKFQVYRNNEWIPIFMTGAVQNSKEAKFDHFEIPTNKFPDEDKSRIKIKLYQSNISKEQVELGETDQLYVMDLFSKTQKSQPFVVQKQSEFIGQIFVQKFQRITRDSFISYIVNGAHLHLIVAIDFSQSNTQNQKSLHLLQNQTNQYIQAMRQIIGVLQYFDYYNQIALYGFGAKLPPYYRSVGQSFALNGNFFQPKVVGIDELIKVYKQNLKKLRMHGPSRITQILKLAYQFASGQQTTDYYVAVIFTDGYINDGDDAINQILKANDQPLSIIFVGVGNGQFDFLKKITDSKINSQKQNSPRNTMQFIQFQKFKKQKAGENNIVKQTFKYIPKQFIQYMKKKDIKPNKKNKKGLKNAKFEFILAKINQSKKRKLEKPKQIMYYPKFLNYKKTQLKKNLQQLGFEGNPLLETLQICLNDINYFIQVQSSLKKVQPQIIKDEKKIIYLKQTNRLDQLIENKQKQNKKKTLIKLQKNQNSNYSKLNTKKLSKKLQPQPQVIQKLMLQHPCIQCKLNQINIVYYQCGHACCCQNCQSLYCQICRVRNTKSYKINFKQSQ